MKTQLAIFLILFFTFATYGNTYSQISQKSIADSAKIDKSKTKIAKITASQLAKYKSDKDFDYTTQNPENKTLKSWYAYLLDKILHKLFGNEGAVPYVRYSAAVIILGIAIFFIYKAKFQGIFVSDANADDKLKLAYSDEDINEKNLELKLQNAVNEQNFRLAIRFYYILLLKNLDKKNLIKWELGKTNKDYGYELKDKSICNTFNSLSNLYEYSWYGNFAISEYSFNKYKNNFDLVLKEIEQYRSHT